MILLDTDHLSILQLKISDRRNRLVSRIGLAVDERFAAPIVGVEEQMRGWLSSIAKERQARRQVASYRDLGSLFEIFAASEIINSGPTELPSLNLRGSKISKRRYGLVIGCRPVNGETDALAREIGQGLIWNKHFAVRPCRKAKPSRETANRLFFSSSSLNRMRIMKGLYHEPLFVA